MGKISSLIFPVFVAMILLGIVSSFINFGLTEAQQFAFLLGGSIGYGLHCIAWIIKEAAQRGYFH